jgi:prolipoprotein diacylglyceryltransferase
MFPIIFSLGRFELRTINVFLLLAFLAGAFIFWRKGKEEHYSEMEVFDGFLLSLIFGFVLGRISFVFFELEAIGINFIKWLDIFSYPGINSLVFFVAASLYLYRFALKKKWDVFEILDFAVLGFTLSQVFLWLGLFFEGSGFGIKTGLPIGMVFPSVFEAHHPLQLYRILFYLILFVYLSKAEYRYRTFEWYRYGKKTAQTGFLTSMFFIFSGLFSVVISFLAIPEVIFYGLRLDFGLGILTFLFGLFLLGLRSGRISTKFFGKRNKVLLEKFKV